MKIKMIVGAAMVAVVITFTNQARAVDFTDAFNGPNVDPGWVQDRALPQSVGIANVDGHSAIQLGVTASGYQSDSFYDYQGLQHSVSVSGNWTASAQIDVTSAMLNNLANVGFWIRTGNGSDESTADYDILAFRNPDGSSPGLYSWDDVNGNWLLEKLITSSGWVDLGMDYTGSSVQYSVDGTLVRTDTSTGNPLYDGDVTTAFLEVYNYGNNGYNGNFDNVSVGVPDSVSTLGLLSASIGGIIVIGKRKKLIA